MQANCAPVTTKKISVFFVFMPSRFARSFECRGKVSWPVNKNHMKRKKIFIRSHRVHESLLIYLSKAKTVDTRQIFQSCLVQRSGKSKGKLAHLKENSLFENLKHNSAKAF